MGHKHVCPLFWRKMLPLIYWNLPFAPEDNTVYIFQGCLLYRHLWNDKPDPRLVSASAHKLCRNTRDMENCLPRIPTLCFCRSSAPGSFYHELTIELAMTKSSNPFTLSHTVFDRGDYQQSSNRKRLTYKPYPCLQVSGPSQLKKSHKLFLRKSPDSSWLSVGRMQAVLIIAQTVLALKEVSQDESGSTPTPAS